ncbi:DUF2339 domain-containing protein [Phosphitispora sp. TUW77]|uniref:DUF2339 domain-containing protein n=1 Tax=Phosphitispora sp. TUW77 TaxID=3152361 RepID=UPI003AB12797
MDTRDKKLLNLEERVQSLENENKSLLHRVSALENRTETIKAPKSPKTIQHSAMPNLVKRLKMTDGLTAELTELKIGGTLLNRIGIVAFIFGLGFFLKYSFDNNWIGPTGRVVIGIVAGILLLAAGEYGQRRKYKIFSQGLTGGGIASLYFSIFAAFSFYHLLGQTIAYGIMILITTAAVLLSIRYNSFATALLGIVGGFLTPFFLNTGTPNEVGLFTYIVFLNCGILTLAAYKNWRIINIISFVLTFLISVIWASSPDSVNHIWINQIFYTIFFVIFALAAVFYNFINRVQTRNDDLVLIIANAVVFFALSFFNLKQDYNDYMGLLPFLMALFYFILGYLAWIRNREDRFLVISLWGLSIVLITITMPIQLDGKWITAAWAVEAAVLLWLGIFNKSHIVRMFSLCVLAIALLRLPADSSVYTYWYHESKLFYPIFNLNMIPFLSCIAASFIMSRLYYRNIKNIASWEKTNWIWLTVLGVIFSAIYLSLETFYFCGNYLNKFSQTVTANEIQVSVTAIIWFAASILLTWFGSRNRLFEPHIVSIGLFAIGFFLLIGSQTKFYLYSNIQLLPVLNVRGIPYLAGVITALYTSKKLIGYQGLSQDVLKPLSVGAAVIANMIVMIYLSLEVYGFYHAWGEIIGLKNNIDKAVQMTLSVVWTLYAIGLMAAGFIWKRSPLRYMSIIIFGVTIFKVFLFDLANLDTIYRIVSFIVLGGLLVVVSFLYQKYRNRIMSANEPNEQKGVK